MDESEDEHEYKRLLVFMEFPDPVKPKPGFVRKLAYMDAELVGFYDPDEVDSGEEYEQEIESVLTELSEEFEEEGIRTTTEIVSGSDADEAREEVASRDEMDATLIPGDSNTLRKFVIGVRNSDDVETLSEFVEFVDEEEILNVTILHVFDSEEEEAEDVKGLLSDMEEELIESGIDKQVIKKKMLESNNPVFELIQVSKGNTDMTVLGKTHERVDAEVFGPISSQVAEDSDTAVLVVY
jgi:nucleotide-binding universal stress UspA family protein